MFKGNPYRNEQENAKFLFHFASSGRPQQKPDVWSSLLRNLSISLYSREMHKSPVIELR